MIALFTGGFPIVEMAVAYKIGQWLFKDPKKKETVSQSIQTPTAAEGVPMPNNKSGDSQTDSGLVNPLGEPLNTSISDLGSRPKNSSGVSSVKPRCKIEDLHIGKLNTGEDYAYILAGRDTEREQKYGEVIYEHTVYPHDVIGVESEGRSKWGFLLVEKLPRWRKIVRGIAGLITLVGGTALLTPFVTSIPAAIISAAAAIGVRKLLTLGRSVHFEAETAGLHLTGSAPKRDYDIFERLVREATHKVVSSADVSVCLQH